MNVRKVYKEQHLLLYSSNNECWKVYKDNIYSISLNNKCYERITIIVVHGTENKMKITIKYTSITLNLYGAI